ncbi:MAG: TolC family protein [Pseudomonadota bacterium]
MPRSAHALLLAVLLVQAPAGVAAELLAPSSGPASTPSVSSARSLSLGTALRQALATNPGTQIRREELEAAEAAVLQAQGIFDPVLGSSVGRSRTLRPLRSDEIIAFQALGNDLRNAQVQQSTTYQVGVGQTLLNGTSLGAGFLVSSNADSVQSAAGVPPQMTSAITFTVRVPLARNSGRATVGAEFDAARAEVDAAQAEIHHGNAVLVLESTLAYWDWVAKVRRLEVTAAAERRVDNMIGEMKRLIASGEMPKADIELALASRAERIAQRVIAEQAVIEARRVLARLLGVTAEQAGEFGSPVDDFPPYRPVSGSQRDARLIERALDVRADLQALRQREQAARFRAAAALHNIKPQVDLSFNAGYLGLAENASAWRLDRSLERRTGPAMGAALSVQLPWNNNSAIGAQRTTAAQFNVASIRLRDLQASIGTNIPVALASLERASVQGAAAIEAVQRYEASVRNERLRRRLGTATVIDVITVEDRLTSALLTDVALRQNFASAIAQFRFELGQLVQRDGEEYRVALDALLSGGFSAD